MNLARQINFNEACQRAESVYRAKRALAHMDNIAAIIAKTLSDNDCLFSGWTRAEAEESLRETFANALHDLTDLRTWEERE